MLILQTFIMIALTVITYLVAKKLQEKYKHPLLNPALISSLFIIIILLIFSHPSPPEIFLNLRNEALSHIVNLNKNS